MSAIFQPILRRVTLAAGVTATLDVGGVRVNVEMGNDEPGGPPNSLWSTTPDHEEAPILLLHRVREHPGMEREPLRRSWWNCYPCWSLFMHLIAFRENGPLLLLYRVTISDIAWIPSYASNVIRALAPWEILSLLIREKLVKSNIDLDQHFLDLSIRPAAI